MASCASDGTTGFGPGNRQNKQSIHQTMKKGWNRWSTQKTKVMARRTPLERWNGLAWVCTPWLWKRENGLAGVCMEWLWKGLARCGGEGSSGTTVFPQTQRVRLVRLPLCGCDLTTSISSPRTSYGNNCESAQTDDLPRQPSKKYSTNKPMFRTTFVTCSRTSQTDGYRRPRRTGFLPQKKSPKKPINRMCLGEESTDDSTQSGNSTTGQRQRGPPR